MYDEQPDYQDYQPYQSKPRSPVAAAILTSIVTTTALFFGLRWAEGRGMLGSLLRRGPGHVEVPSLLGMRPDQARELLQGRELLLAITAEHDDAQYPAGAIAAQTPLAGSQVPRGSAVQAVVSRGHKQPVMPNLVGLRAEEAERQLAAAGLTVAPRRAQPSATAAAGLVLATEPAAGTPVPAQTAVALAVSSGPAAGAPGAVPKVTGMRASKARKRLEEAGFKVGKIRYVIDGEAAGGVVLEQSPAAEAPAPGGATVDLVVNGD